MKVKKKINEKAQMAIEEVERDLNRVSRWSLIQALIPLGIKAVEVELQQEICAIAGERYSRGREVKRWGSNPGSVFLGDQKVRINVPRARNVRSNAEVSLSSYEGLQSPGDSWDEPAQL